MQRPRLLIISQVYPPDPAAVGQYIADAAEEVARRGWDVVVYTSARGYDNPATRYPAREHRGGVDVRRLPLSSFGKRSIAIRLAAQSLFVAQAFVRSLFAGPFSRILVSTSPPFAGFCGAMLSWFKHTPFIWWVMDLNPDQMVAAGKLLPGSAVARIFDWMNRLTIRRAAAVVVLDRFMRDRVLAKVPGETALAAKCTAIPPWSLDTHLTATPADIAAFRRRHGLEDKFVVMYAGNHSEQNPLDTLLEVAERLRNLDRLAFVFVGGGAGKVEIEHRILQGATNIVSLPYQRIECLATTLAAADVHVVSVGNSMVGIVHPCKIYSAMAAGRPILLFGPDPCHASEIIGSHGAGWHLAHGDTARAEKTLRDAILLPRAELESMGTRAAETAIAAFSRHALLDQFIPVLLD